MPLRFEGARISCGFLVPRQGGKQPCIDQPPEVARYARRQRTVTDEQADLDVSLETSFREVCRGHEHCLVVGHYCLGVEDTAWAVELERPRVVIHARARCS